MADATHLAKLLEGVVAWNSWREADPGIMPHLRTVDHTEFALRRTRLYERDENGHSKPNLEYANLQGAKLSGANLQGAELWGANLQGADLRCANLRGAYLRQANLQGADLRETLQGQHFVAATLQGADLEYANLQGTKLSGANLQGAELWGANLQGADLRCADLRGASLGQANLQGADLRCADLRDADVTAVQFDRSSRQLAYRGIRVSGCYGSQLFKSFAQDQDYIEGLRESGPWGEVKFWLWWLFADCGRSFIRWGVWSLGLATLFGYIYYWMGPFHFKLDHSTFDSFAMIYYSIVTFTTLGFGDIKPSTPEGAGVLMLEVILGYIMLGGLVSILANKLARRT